MSEVDFVDVEMTCSKVLEIKICGVVSLFSLTKRVRMKNRHIENGFRIWNCVGPCALDGHESFKLQLSYLFIT